jgi:hypothetical protein
MAETSPSKLDLLREKEAQQDQVTKKTQEAASGTTQTVGQPLWTPEIGLQLSYSILIFGLIVLVMMSVLVAKYTVNINRLLRAFALVLIIVAAIFLIVAGYNEQQIAPAMGLLGTIAGYLLGSRHANGETGETDRGDGPNPNPPPGPAGPGGPAGQPAAPAADAGKDAGQKQVTSGASDAGDANKKTGEGDSSPGAPDATSAVP